MAGDAAVLVDPYDTVDIKEGLKRALTDEALRSVLESLATQMMMDIGLDSPESEGNQAV